jgi:LmbE family N-acetylglucosaminyl deacetylase
MRLLLFVAHPDDEMVFAGGLLALMAGRDASVHILSATRGEGGETGEPPLCSRAELGAVREAELRCAAHALGAASLEFLGYRDPEVGPDESLFAFADDPREVAQRLAHVIGARRPEVLLCHGTNGEYGHPAHRMVNQAARLAVDYLACEAPLIYTFSADYLEHPRPRLANRDDPADFVFDISPAFEQKLAAARCHRTQGALFVRRISREGGYPVPLEEALLRIETLRCLLPAPEPPGSPPADLFARWLRENLSHVMIPFTRRPRPAEE